MNFFHSIFADDPDPPGPESDPTPNPDQPQPNPDPTASDHHQTFDDAGQGGMWNFGGLIKNLTVKSESVIETYRRDLKEFGSGLKKEIEVAQGSLGTVGHAIDEIVIKGTAQIISQGKEAILAVSPDNPESDSDNSSLDRAQSGGLSSKRYSRFDAQVRAVQGDPETYVDEPEDKEEFEKWRLGFELEGKREEMGKLLVENAEMGSVYRRLVPGNVDEDGFWFRYYYKVDKLQLAEDMRAKIVRRAISRDEEELSWDVDDDDDEEEEEEMGQKAGVKKSDVVEGNTGLGREGSVEVVKEDLGVDVRREEGKNEGNVDAKEVKEDASADVRREGDGKNVGKVDAKEVKEDASPDVRREGDGKSEGNVDAKEVKEYVGDARNLDEGLKVEKVAGGGESDAHKDVDVEEKKGMAVVKDEQIVGAGVLSKDVSAQEEEDLGWDEIEDLSGIDEKRVSHSGTSNKVDLMKRLSSAEEEEEDLSWDIEEEDDDDDKDHVKA